MPAGRPPGPSRAVAPPAPPEAYLADGAGPRPRKLGSGPVCVPHVSRSIEEHLVIIFFETLLVLVAVGVLAFTGLAVKKLYQGQR